MQMRQLQLACVTKKYFHVIDMAIEDVLQVPGHRDTNTKVSIFRSTKNYASATGWRLELKMIGWDSGGIRDRLPENEDNDLDIEPDRVDERLVDSVWLRVQR